MAEWLMLLLLVPAIVVPAVLLLGFAGCLTKPDFPKSVPVIVSALGTSVSSIELTWIDDGFADIEFERTRLPEPGKPLPMPSDPDYEDYEPKNFLAGSSPHSDPDLERATGYNYRARALYGDEGPSNWSPTVFGSTLAGFVILDITQDGSFGNVDMNTVKCEIAVADLTVPPFTPARMWITLGQRAEATENITFSRVFIGHKAAAGDPWDAVSLTTPVLFGGGASTVLMPGETRRSDEIAGFTWDGMSALILSMYFAGGPSSDQLAARTTGSSNTYLKGGDEAATADATGYGPPFPGLGYLSGVVKIEVA